MRKLALLAIVGGLSNIFLPVSSLATAQRADKCNYSEVGMRFASESDLIDHLGELYLLGERESLFQLLRAKYFDYGPYLSAFCEKLDDRKVVLSLVDDLSDEFGQMAADCLAIAAKSHRNLRVGSANPLQSIHFRAKHWSQNMFTPLIRMAFGNENAKWTQIIKDIPESKADDYLNVADWNDAPGRLWSAISITIIDAASQNNRNRIFKIASSTLEGEGLGDLIARLLLVGYFYRRTSVRTTHEFLEHYGISTTSSSLIQNLSFCLRTGGSIGPCQDYQFFAQLFTELKASSFETNFAPFLNLFFHASHWFQRLRAWERIVSEMGAFFYNFERANWPSVTETCSILLVRKEFDPVTVPILSRHLANRPAYLKNVFFECPQAIPNYMMLELLAVEHREELFFKSSRGTALDIGEFSLEVDLTQLEHHQSVLLMICNQLESLHTIHRRSLLRMRVSSNIVVSNGLITPADEQVHPFTFLIQTFFNLFLSQSAWYILNAKGELIPSAHCPPQILFSFGMLIAAAVIYQEELPFKLSQEYFKLIDTAPWDAIVHYYQSQFPAATSIESNIVSYIHEPLFLLTAASIQPPVQATSIGEMDQIDIFYAGLEKFSSGLEAACYWDLFSVDEFYRLIPFKE